MESPNPLLPRKRALRAAFRVVARLMAQPAAWMLAAALVVAPGALWLMGSTSICSVNISGRPFLYDFAFLSSVAGATLIVGTLENLAWPRQRVSVLERLELDLAVFVLGNCIFVATALVSWMAWKGLSLETRSPPSWGSGILIALHVASVGVALLRCRLPKGTAALFLPIVCWVLPALTPLAGLTRIPPVALHDSGLQHLCGSWSAGVAAFGPMLVMLLTALLLEVKAPRGS